jgi:AraC family transcriptional regulator of arabinose operon
MIFRPDSPVPPAGQLTTGLFRMKKHYARWRKHGTPGWLLVYTLDGKGRFGHAQGELIVKKGDLALLQPLIRHDYGLEKTDRTPFFGPEAMLVSGLLFMV